MKKYLLIAFALVLTFALTGCGSDNENQTEEEKTLKTDKMAGTWYSYDKYGLKEHDSYMVIDGEGNFYNVIGNYSFYKGDGNYTINDDKVIFYTDSAKTKEWNNCTLKTDDKMLCVQKGGSATYYQR